MPHLKRLPSGSWRAEVRDPGGRKYGKTFDLKGQAGAWATEEEAKIGRGGYIDPRRARQPVAELIERWWAGRVVEATTAASDRSRLDSHVIPEWGSWRVEAVTTSAVQAWVQRLGRGDLSAWSTRACYNLLSAVMETARLDGLVPANPCRGVKLPAKPPSRELYLTQDEVDRVAATMARRPAAADLDRAVLYAAAYCGLRWGELAGLTVQRLDPVLRHLDVVETLIEVDGHFAVKPYPKGRRRRQVPIPELLRDVLAEHLQRYPPETDGLGTLVFRPRCLGYRYGRGAALSRHRWPRLAYLPAVFDALGRTDLRTHDLRHSYASWLVQNGRPIAEVAKLIGDTIQTTERYAHLAPTFHDQTVAALRRPSPGGRRVPASSPSG